MTEKWYEAYHKLRQLRQYTFKLKLESLFEVFITNLLEPICVKYFLKESPALPPLPFVNFMLSYKNCFPKVFAEKLFKKIQNIDRKSYMVVNFLISKDTLKDFFPSHF